jgi:uncharacterized protein YdeI (YjbR/CyaY-like superfamily)
LKSGRQRVFPNHIAASSGFLRMKPKFFKSPADFRKWPQTHHVKETEQWVGFYKKDSGKQSITWPESVDEALCFGWIDGIRKSIDEISYKIRFTPRRPRSIWSAVNIKRVGELIKQGSVQEAGLKAFAAREENRSGIYSYEQRSAELPDHYGDRLKKNKAARKFFEAQPASYRKAATWWVLSAKKEETRLKRLDTLIDDSAHQRTIHQFTAMDKRITNAKR